MQHSLHQLFSSVNYNEISNSGNLEGKNHSIQKPEGRSLKKWRRAVPIHFLDLWVSNSLQGKSN